MFDRIARFILQARWLLLALLVAASVALGLPATQIVFDFSPRSIFLTADEEVSFLKEHRTVFGEEDGIVMVLLEADDVFAPDVLQLIVDLSDDISEVEGIESVLSLATVPRLSGSPPVIEVSPLLDEVPETDEEGAELKEIVLANRIYVHRFVSPNAQASALLAMLDGELIEELDRRPCLDAIEGLLEQRMGATDGVTLTMIGVPVVNREYAILLQKDMTRTVGMSVLLIAIVLMFLFRNPVTVALPLTAVGLSLTWTIGYMVLWGDKINIINSIIPTLLLVIGVGDAVHFLTTYYQELGAGSEKQTAIRSMVRRIGAACLLTSITAAIGFASLMVARIDIIKGMGRVAAVGLLVSYFVILLLVPSVLSLTKPPKAGVHADPKSGWIGRLLTWTGVVVTNHKAKVVTVTALICAASVIGGMRVKTDNFLLEELFPQNRVSQALARTEAVLTGVMPVEVSIRTDTEGGVLEPDVLRGMVEVQKHFGDDPFIGHSASVADLILEIGRLTRGTSTIPDTRAEASQRLLYFEMGEDPSFLDSMVDVTRSHARISATQRDWGTSNFFAWYDGSKECDPRATCGEPILDIVDRAFGTTGGVKPGLEVRVTGSNLVAARALDRLVEDMVTSLLTAFFVISLLMMLLLRSFRIGLLSMVPNLIPLLMTFGVMGWIGIPLRTSTSLIFSVALGVAVNDTIHFVTRFKEELFLRGDRVEAVRATLLSTGRAIIFTSILMIFGFATMMTTRFVGIFQMGLLGAVTLMAALIGDLLLLPVCLVIFRPWERYIEKKQRDGTWKPVELGNPEAE
ncbi:MAG: MMPL family transporter [Proteobacteria bacterium]|nr:MMPL family transporter [Pseudomonadota bacterium]